MKVTLTLATLILCIGGLAQTASAVSLYTPPVLGRDWYCTVLNVSNSTISVTLTVMSDTGLTLAGPSNFPLDPGRSGFSAGSEVSDFQIYCKITVNKASKVRALISTIDSDDRLHEQAAK